MAAILPNFGQEIGHKILTVFFELPEAREENVECRLVGRNIYNSELHQENE